MKIYRKKFNYDGKLFVKDRHQDKLTNNEINYRCKHNRKDERMHTTAFCKALIKRKIEKSKYYKSRRKPKSIP